jgi:ribonuclease BN (tRNA processing enzyme)
VDLTVLGKSPSWQDRDGACSGYLVELADTLLMLDCGNGVFAKLRAHDSYERVDAVVISHLHADHILDLVPFAYALTYGPGLRSSRPQLHAPPGARDALRRLCGAWGSEGLIENAFELREYDPSAELHIGKARLGFQPVPHYVPSNAIEVRADGSPRRLVFGADCGPSDVLASFAEGAELLLIESTLSEEVTGHPAGHLTAAQAGAIGERAGVEQLVLTHFSDQLDSELVRASAEAQFGRAVDLAAIGARYAV